MLQGIWVDSYDEGVAFKVVDDSIFYPTENVLPAYFRIADDTLYIDDIKKSKYAIKRLSPNILEFENRKLFSNMIDNWRTDWNDAELPFVFVQLTVNRYEQDKDFKHWCLIREAQAKAHETIKNVWMTCALDLGQYSDIHPKAKKVLAENGISEDIRVKDLTDEQVNAIRKTLDSYKLEGDLRRETQLNIKRLMEVACYRGIRHRKGLPVRGQRTKTNARTRKGPRRTVANKKK